MAFDLNLSNYQDSDLRALFKLPPNFNEADLAQCEQAIRVQLFTEELPEDLKMELDSFLTAASARLKPGDLIPSSAIPYVPTRVEEFTRGVVNPYDKRTFARVLSFDTLYRTNYAATPSNDLLCTLPDTVRNAISMELVGIDFPCTAYPTFASQTGSSSFLLTIHRDSDTELTVTLPNGDYSPAEFEQVANQALATAGADFLVFYVTQGKVVLRAKTLQEPGNLYDPDSPDYYPTFTYTITFPSGEGSAGRKMGFALTQYTTNADKTYKVYDQDKPTPNLVATYRNYLEAEGYLINEGCHYFFLDVDDFHNNFQTNTITTNRPTFITNNVLARISVRHDKVEISHASREYLGPVRIEKLNIRLLDKHGTPVSWIRDYAVALKFTLLYS